jgi:hypothetical protein
MLKRLLSGIILCVSAMCIGMGLQYTQSVAQADQGCTNSNATRRATLVTTAYPNTYKTCAMPASMCSSYNPTWTKAKSHTDWATMSPVIDYVYTISGGSITGLPVCPAEISAVSGWIWNG